MSAFRAGVDAVRKLGGSVPEGLLTLVLGFVRPTRIDPATNRLEFRLPAGRLADFIESSRTPDASIPEPPALVAYRPQMIGCLALCTTVAARDWVEVVVDVAQVVGAAGAVIALWLAGRANAASKKQAAVAIDHLVHERRIEFELGILRDIARLVATPDFVIADGPVRAQIMTLVALLGYDQVPLTCAAVGLEAPSDAKTAVDDALRLRQPGGGAVLTLVLGEVRSAIFQRVAERLAGARR